MRGNSQTKSPYPVDPQRYYSVPPLLFVCVSLFLGYAQPSQTHQDLNIRIFDLNGRIELEPGNVDLLFRRGVLNLLSENWEAALDDFRTVLAIDPGHPLAELGVARAFLSLGKTDLALDTIRRFRDRRPDHPDGLILQARIMREQGLHEEAARSFSKAIERISQPQPDLYLERARTLMRLGPNYTQAALQGLDEGLRKLGPIVSLRTLAIELELERGDHEAALRRKVETEKAAKSKKKRPLRASPAESRPLELDSASIPKGATPLLVTRGPYLQIGTPTSVIVRWRTNLPTDSLVRYGTGPANLTHATGQLASTTEHQVAVKGMSPDTKYYYSVGNSTGAIAGATDPYFFVTAPPTGVDKPTRIWVLGDSGTGNLDAQSVRDAFYGLNESPHPDLWLMLGDNAYLSGTDQEYQKAVFDMYPETLQTSVLWPTLGNHDGISAFSVNQSGPYYDIFSLPMNGEAGGLPSGTEAYYSFDYGNIHFICLESHQSVRSSTGAMMTWLAADIAGTTQDWIVAFWHHPPYSKGAHDSDSELNLMEMRENALPILEAGGVDLVLTGHSHSYERSYFLDAHYGTSDTLVEEQMILDNGDGRTGDDGAYRKQPGSIAHQGAVYAVCGSSGRVTLLGSLDHPVMCASFFQLGSMIIDVRGDRLDAVFVDAFGEIRDFFTIFKRESVMKNSLWRLQ